MAIDYLYKNPSIFGEPCPICGRKTWNIFKCEKCGKIFCKYCRPDLVTIDDESENMEVICDCGSSALFVD